MCSKKSDKLIIRAHGAGFVFVSLIILLFLTGGMYILIEFFIPNSEIYHSWRPLCISLIGLGIFGYEFIKLFYQSYVAFDGGNLITNGKQLKDYPKINESCQKFMDYRFTSSLGGMGLKLKLNNNKRLKIHVSMYNRRQLKQILTEIQKRGGLQVLEIDLKRYKFSTTTTK